MREDFDLGPTKFNFGDLVELRGLSSRPMRGVVVERRGALGYGGVQMYRVMTREEPHYRDHLMREDEMTMIDPAPPGGRHVLPQVHFAGE